MDKLKSFMSTRFKKMRQNKRKPQRRRNAPVALRARSMKSKWSTKTTSDKTARLVGNDYVSSVDLRPTTDKNGTCVLQIPLNPYVMKCNRLAHMAQLYEFWTIRKLVVRFAGSMPSTTNGLLNGYIDYDARDAPIVGSTSAKNLQMAHAHTSCKTCKVWENCTWVWADQGNVRLKELFCNPEAGTGMLQSYAGNFNLLIETPVGVAVNQTIGQIYIEYDIAFRQPQLDDNLYGYANKYTATGSVTSANPFGAWVSAWGNVPVSADFNLNTFSVYPGNYIFYYYDNGAAMNAPTFTVDANATKVMEYSGAEGSTVLVEMCQFYALDIAVCTFHGNAGALNANNAIWFLVSLPYEGSTLLKQLIEAKQTCANLSKTIKAIHPIDEIKEPMIIVEEKEDKSPIMVVKEELPNKNAKRHL